MTSGGKPCETVDVVRAVIEDYRGGLTIDRHHDEADRAGGNRLRLPMLVAWSQQDVLEDFYGDRLVVWRDCANSVRGHSTGSGHAWPEKRSTPRPVGGSARSVSIIGNRLPDAG